MDEKNTKRSGISGGRKIRAEGTGRNAQGKQSKETEGSKIAFGEEYERQGTVKNMRFEFFHTQQVEQYAFYRIPKIFFTDSRFRRMSVKAKILYGLMLDRVSLSLKNRWIDKEGRVYIIYTIQEIMESLGCAEQKAVKILSELEKSCGLIQKNGAAWDGRI